MFVRGSGTGQEYKRMDSTLFRGIVVKNDDPLRLNRVKVYIPEITNQPYDGWFEAYDAINVKAPGVNNETDNWTDVKIFEEIAKLIPWAEISYPVMGESGCYRYYNKKNGEISTISDCNYEDGFQINDMEPVSLALGSFCPAYIYENVETAVGDAFSNPVDNLSVKCNPYAYSYRPSKHVNKSKGMFGVPEVGAKVWVYHYDGDMNFPIVTGIYHDYRELTLINDTDNPELIGPEYPSNFEN